MSDKYILDGHSVIPCEDIFQWGEWFEKANRSVARTQIGKAVVSTVFLGIDHSFGYGLPLLFETMIFGGPHDDYQARCSTWDEAVKMHELACAELTAPELEM